MPTTGAGGFVGGTGGPAPGGGGFGGGFGGFAPPAAAAPGLAADRAVFNARRGGINSYDLLADIKAGKVKLDSLKDEELPEELRKLPKEKRQAYLDELEKKRREAPRGGPRPGQEARRVHQEEARGGGQEGQGGVRPEGRGAAPEAGEEVRDRLLTDVPLAASPSAKPRAANRTAPRACQSPA